jgi:hypothetical protein
MWSNYSFEHLFLGFCNHSPPCPRGGLCRHCASGSLALAPPGGPSSMFLRSWWALSDLQLRHLMDPRWEPVVAPSSMSSTLVVAAAGPCHQHPTDGGPAIDVFNFSGGRCRTLPPAPPRGPTIDVFNFSGGHCRTCRQHPQRVRHRRLQLRCWPLPDLTASTPQGPRHRRLQLRKWPLPDLLPAPPRGPAIDIFNFSGGRYRTYRQHPPGPPPSTSPTFKPPAPTPLGGPPSTFLSVDGGHSWTSSSGTSRGPPSTTE